MGPLKGTVAADWAGTGGGSPQDGHGADAPSRVELHAAARALAELLSSPAGQAAAAATAAAAERARLRQHPAPALDFGLPATASAIPSATFVAQLLGQDGPAAEGVGLGTSLVRLTPEGAAVGVAEQRAEIQQAAAGAYTRVAEAARAFIARRYGLQVDGGGAFVSALRMVDIVV